MQTLEAQLMQRWQNWLKTPGAAERVIEAVRKNDTAEFERLFRAATAVDHPLWVKAIAAANAKVV